MGLHVYYGVAGKLRIKLGHDLDLGFVFKLAIFLSHALYSQIAQMVAAGMVNLYAYDVKRRGGRCDQSDGAIRLVMILAVSYFTLFTWFFFNSYIWKGKGAQKVHES